MSRIPILRPLIPRLTGRSVPAQPKQRDAVYAGEQYLAWRKAVVQRAGFTCERCGAVGKRLFADHIIELKDGGNPFDLANGQALCGQCHTIKTLMERGKRLAT